MQTNTTQQLKPKRQQYKNISPYFTSVKRPSKNKGTIQNTISIIKYPSSTINIQRSQENRQRSQEKLVEKLGDKLGDKDKLGEKKKVFKRFGKFEQIDQQYTYNVKTNKFKVDNQQSQQKIHKNTKYNNKISTKQALYTNKTLALIQKYSSYKSISTSTPKISKNKDKIITNSQRQQKQQRQRHNSFRTKIRLGNTLYNINRNGNENGNIYHGHSNININNNTNNNINNENVYEHNNQDWLCKQLIQNQVYSIYDDQFY